ncbi:MAG TPA: Holliday junction branch migration protein RuvA [Pseudomonadales bacterium]|nr:Holliday junction branch migration protein RuvA [Pseudomonadales bacterium]
MIGFLRGRVVERQPPLLLLDVNGVGYEVLAPMSTFYRLPLNQPDVLLYTQLVIREDAHTLYGFFDKKDRSLFQALIKINGVGPKLALGILSGMEPDAFVLCVRHGDASTLTKLPGIGNKTAERLVVEMRDKFKQWEVLPTTSEATGDKQELIRANQLEAPATLYVREAEEALIALGYKPAEALRMIAKVKDQGADSESLIRLALKGVLP